MRLLINTASTFKGGGIQVAKSFIEECKNFSQHAYFVVMSEPISKSIDQGSFPDNFSFYTAPFRPATKVFSFQSHNGFFKEIEKKWKPDVVFTTSGPSYWRPKVPHLTGYNIPHYVYPESPYFKRLPLSRKLWWIGMKIFAKRAFGRNSDAFVVQTNDVNKRLQSFLNTTQVHTVYNTINSHYLNSTTVENKLAKRTDGEFRLLTLSAWYPHKNLDIIPKVIAELNDQDVKVKFVVTLPDVDFERLKEQSDTEHIINVGRVKIEEGPSLYKECDVLFLPTLLECFSASYVEAMKMGKPILTSDLGFAHTICEDAAVYFDPMQPKDIAQKINEVIQSSALQTQLVNSGSERLNTFGSATERAVQYLNLCESLLNES